MEFTTELLVLNASSELETSSSLILSECWESGFSGSFAVCSDDSKGAPFSPPPVVSTKYSYFKRTTFVHNVGSLYGTVRADLIPREKSTTAHNSGFHI